MFGFSFGRLRKSRSDSSLPGIDLEKWEKKRPSYEPISRESRTGSRFRRNANGVWELRPSKNASVATIVCVGDILCEGGLHRTHTVGDAFEFDSIYSFVRPIICDSDLAIANLETTVCESSPYTGEQHRIEGRYHCNAPTEFLDAVDRAGFDFLMLANNHCLDSGVGGVLETLRRIDEKGIMRTGLFSPEDKHRGEIVEINGIRLGLLSYSTWFNRNEDRLTELGRCWIVNEYAQEKVRSDVSALRERGAEFVLTYIHWETDAEYARKQTASMEAVALELANAGVDYIVGSHTHSTQPYVSILADDGRVVPCVYSMGNFVTSDFHEISRDSILLKITLEKRESLVVVSDEEMIPCHVPDALFGIGFPVVPEMFEFAAGASGGSIESCRKGFARTRDTFSFALGGFEDACVLAKGESAALETVCQFDGETFCSHRSLNGSGSGGSHVERCVSSTDLPLSPIDSFPESEKRMPWVTDGRLQ